MLGEHSLAVRAEVAAPEFRNAFFFSRVIWFTASATDEVGTSTIASTLSVSNHWRAMLAPTSGLFWWSAETISTFIPLPAAPKSSTAICAASTEPGPAMSAYRLDMSLSTPILTTSSETWALAVPGAAASSCKRARHQPRRKLPFHRRVSWMLFVLMRGWSGAAGGCLRLMAPASSILDQQVSPGANGENVGVACRMKSKWSSQKGPPAPGP